jgi:hypothetical protein
MSAFANPDATEVIDLDREYCPPKPDGTPYHDHDSVTVKTDYSYGDLLFVSKLGQATPGILWDNEMATLGLLSRAIRGWSFVDDEGKPVEIGLPMIRLLHAEVADKVAEVADRHYTESTTTLPNVSGAPSPASSPESRSASPKRKRKRSTRS